MRSKYTFWQAAFAAEKKAVDGRIGNVTNAKVTRKLLLIHCGGIIRTRTKMERIGYMPNQHASEVSGTPEESDLLAELADLAAKKTQTEQTDEQKRLERSKNVHIALNRIYQYFSQFFEHLKAVKPATALSFQLDQKTAYSNIHWIEANADLRRQNLSDSALVDHVSLLIKFTAPDPVVITRRWNELETLKQELNDFGLRPVEDIYAQVRRQPQKEFVTIELAPDFSMRLQFQGNYEGGDIELDRKSVV